MRMRYGFLFRNAGNDRDLGQSDISDPVYINLHWFSSAASAGSQLVINNPVKLGTKIERNAFLCIYL